MASPVVNAAVAEAQMNTRYSNRAQRHPLTAFQLKKQQEATSIYIYNVSPIHEWQKMMSSMGTIVIPKCPEGQLWSEPVIIPSVVFRWFDKGLRRQEWAEEDGMEIAKDIMGKAASDGDVAYQNDLANYGVFITTKKLEDMTPVEREKILDAPNRIFNKRLGEIIADADAFFNGPEVYRKFIVGIHHNALACYNKRMNADERRPWSRVVVGTPKVECVFCGHANVPGKPKCANCHEIIDRQQYDKLKGK